MKHFRSWIAPLFLATLASAQSSTVIAWGSNTQGECSVPPPPPGVDYVQVDCGMLHSVALRSDGNVVVWGLPTGGVLNVPPLPAGLVYTRVRAGLGYDPGGPIFVPQLVAAIRSDGRAILWGEPSYGQLAVPRLPMGVSYVDVAIGMTHALGLRSDGEIATWGSDPYQYGLLDVPPLPAGTSYVDIAACDRRSLALRSDGAIVSWGEGWSAGVVIPTPPAGVRHTSISLGPWFGFALRSDGAIDAWGPNWSTTNDVPPLPAGLRYVAIEANLDTATAIRSDGALIGWGQCFYSLCDPPSLPAGTVYLEASGSWTHIVARYGPPPQAPSTYCTAKPGSLGCSPAIGFAGSLSTNGGDDFAVTASGIRNQRSGLLFWGRAAAATPFHGGTLCVASPLVRSQLLQSGGNVGVDDCSGTFDVPISQAYLIEHGLVQGSDLHFQFWYRDGSVAPFLIGLSNALHVRVGL